MHGKWWPSIIPISYPILAEVMEFKITVGSISSSHQHTIEQLPDYIRVLLKITLSLLCLWNSFHPLSFFE
jgi:hypothetical protein